MREDMDVCRLCQHVVEEHRSLIQSLRVALLVVLAGGWACSPGRFDLGAPAATCAPPPRRPPGLLVAGSGSNLAVVRRIAVRYEGSHPGAHVVVPESIGTGGATQALLDGAIDVGLASRSLRAKERAAGLFPTPFATTALVFAAHSHVSQRELSNHELAEIYRGQRGAWPDGRPIIPLLREPGDSGWPILQEALPEVAQAMMQAARARRLRVCFTDGEIRDALLSIPGAIGPIDEGTVRLERLPLRILALRGSGRPAGLKDLSFITVGHPAGEAARFINYALSPAVADILRDGAYRSP
jgi:phosphate transport system substrate-binding protein